MVISDFGEGLARSLGRVIAWARKNFWAVVTLVVVGIGSVMVVETFKKPGQMTVLEANVMDMSAMVPPRGAMPVKLEPATIGEIEGSITYTGGVAAYEDEDVYPRITGRIVEMPVYPGDLVRKGQLLVKLDPPTSEYEARLETARHAADAAMHFAGSAKADFEKKKFELEAAEAAEEAAQKTLVEAKAELSYWVPEIKRQANLLKEDVVSQEEYDNEFARYRGAKARAERAEATVRQAMKSTLAARASFEAAVHHVGHEYSASEEARSVEETARIINKYREIVAGRDGVVIERVISPGVVVNPGMVVLKVAHIDRVRVQAEVSSADIARIELGAPVYMKGAENSAEVVKGKVTSIFPAANRASRTSTVEALIDNLRSPAAGADIVTAVRSATQFKFLPGQYVIMTIATGRKEALTIPTRAIYRRGGKTYVWLAVAPGQARQGRKYQCPMHPDVISDEPGKCPRCGMDLERVDHKEHESLKERKTEKKTYTCTMHPEVISDKPGKCPRCGMKLTPTEVGGGKIAQLVPVVLGLSNPDRTEVLKGLEPGDEVVTQGYEDLQPGTPLVGVNWTEEGIERLPFASEVAGNRLDSSNNWKLEQMIDHLMMAVSMKPVPPKNKGNELEIVLEKHGGGKLSRAKITAASSMAGMSMPGPELKASGGGGGIYRMKTNFGSGLWKVDMSIKGMSREPARLALEVEVP